MKPLFTKEELDNMVVSSAIAKNLKEQVTHWEQMYSDLGKRYDYLVKVNEQLASQVKAFLRS